MNDDTLVLGAMLRLARRHVEANTNELFERVGVSEARVRLALARLDKAGLVERRATCARLTMSGLAAAVALAPRRSRAVSKARVGSRAA